MKVSVDLKRCQGHTMCAMTAPDLFDLDDDDGHAIVLHPDVPADMEDLARKAVDGCPENAISIDD